MSDRSPMCWSRSNWPTPSPSPPLRRSRRAGGPWTWRRRDRAHRLAAVVRELVSESRARRLRRLGWTRSWSMPAVPVRDLVVRVTDHRMPAVGETYAGLASFQLARLGFVSDPQFSLGDGNVVQCSITVPTPRVVVDTEQVIPHDATPGR